jgi:prevent-host-death family protein
MLRVPAAEFQRNIGRYQDAALTGPVAVTRNGRARTVLISIEAYRRLTAAAGAPDADAILSALRDLEPDLRAKGVAALFLFGSIARGEGRPASDVDLFVDPARSGFSLLDLAGLQAFLAERLGRDVDLATRDSLHPALRSGIEASALRVF